MKNCKLFLISIVAILTILLTSCVTTANGVDIMYDYYPYRYYPQYHPNVIVHYQYVRPIKPKTIIVKEKKTTRNEKRNDVRRNNKQMPPKQSRNNIRR